MQENTPPISETPIVKPLETKKSPLLMTMLLVLLVLSLGSTVFLAYQNSQLQKQIAKIKVASSPTPIASTDQTASWKTYTNSKFGITLKYPQDWTESGPILNPDTEIVYLHAPPSSSGKSPELAYYIYLSYSNGEQTNERIIKWGYEQITSTNGFSTYRTDKEPGRFGSLSYLIKKDENNYISISLTPYNSNQPSNNQSLYKSIFDQILSTFKFITTTPTPLPTGSVSQVGKGCKLGGCSGELCVDESSENVVSACIYLKEYACYKTAKCEVQTNGRCAWTETEELNKCLSEMSPNSFQLTQ